ncbi:hypothetical protein [Brachybacterium sp. p3-SID957]|uniref:hypothetical protein n=1 Tax=Brachybacterium sp. p3-SID957 TaxID=2916049 RepID=UPI00223B2250|nr:hypothetical protein [Brachybacterium sp. p3-SID957]MCT1774993.1 hypothetical protein [Brachybacterium sp. p3-SID957]
MSADIDRRILDLPVSVAHGEDRISMMLDLPVGSIGEHAGTGGVWEHLTQPELLAGFAGDLTFEELQRYQQDAGVPVSEKRT